MIEAELTDAEAKLTSDHAVKGILDRCRIAACRAVHVDGEHAVVLGICLQNSLAAVDHRGSALTVAACVTHDAVLQTRFTDDLHRVDVSRLPLRIIVRRHPLICDVDDHGILMPLELAREIVCVVACSSQKRIGIVIAGLSF